MELTAYKVLGQLSRMDKVRGIEGLQSDLIGRDEEFSKPRDTLQALLSRRGHIAMITGEAGVGKSRLVAELKRSVAKYRKEGREPLWLEGRCLDLGITGSYGPFIDMFREYFDLCPESNDDARAKQLETCLHELSQDGSLEENRHREIAPVLGDLMSIVLGEGGGDGLQNVDAGQRQSRTFLAIRDLLLALTRRHPVILVLEDLHWADSISLDLISLLMESLATAPLLLLCTCRPDGSHKARHLSGVASRKCPERYTEIILRELTTKESALLIESLLDVEELPKPTKALIAEKAQGNPFFVEEVIRSLIDGGIIYDEGKSWKASRIVKQIELTESVQSVILSRIDRLRDDQKRLLQNASVIGRVFRKNILKRIVDRGEHLDSNLQELQDLALIYQERVAPEVEYSFRHVLTQETIYQTILESHRREHHRAHALRFFADHARKNHVPFRFHSFFQETLERHNHASETAEHVDRLPSVYQFVVNDFSPWIIAPMPQ